MARHYLLALPTPRSGRLAGIVDALRSWCPGLRQEPPGSWHIQLHRLPGRPGRIVGRLRRALQGLSSLPCLVQGIASGPLPRTAREVWANVESPGLDVLRQRVLEAARVDAPVAPSRSAQVRLASLPRATDLRSFLRAHEQMPFSFGRLARVSLLEATAWQGGVRYREVASIPLGMPRPAPAVWHPWSLGSVHRLPGWESDGPTGGALAAGGA